MTDDEELGRPISTDELKEWFGSDWERVGWRLVVNAPAAWPLSKLRKHVRRFAETNAADTDAIAEVLWWVWNALGPNDNMAADWESQTKLAMNHGGAYEDEVLAFRAMARVALENETNGDEVRG